MSFILIIWCHCYSVAIIRTASNEFALDNDFDLEDEDDDDDDDDEDYDDDDGNYQRPAAAMSLSLMEALGMDTKSVAAVTTDWKAPSQSGLEHSARKDDCR